MPCACAYRRTCKSIHAAWALRRLYIYESAVPASDAVTAVALESVSSRHSAPHGAAHLRPEPCL